MDERFDLFVGARRGLWCSSAGCVAGALAALGLASTATDDVHRVMFGVVAASLGVAAGVLEVVRRALRCRTGWR